MRTSIDSGVPTCTIAEDLGTASVPDQVDNVFQFRNNQYFDSITPPYRPPSEKCGEKIFKVVFLT